MSAREERNPTHTYKNYRRWFRYGCKHRVVDGAVLPGKESDADWSTNFRSPRRNEVTDTQLGPISLTLRRSHARCTRVNGGKQVAFERIGVAKWNISIEDIQKDSVALVENLVVLRPQRKGVSPTGFENGTRFLSAVSSQTVHRLVTAVR